MQLGRSSQGKRDKKVKVIGVVAEKDFKKNAHGSSEDASSD